MAAISLGARFETAGTTVTFRVRAPSAARVELWIYPEPVEAPPVLRQMMRGPDDGVFELSLPASALVGPASAIFYGYRAWGPNWPYDPAWQPGQETGFIADVDGYGHRFNPNKLLLDPYAREVSHCVQTPERPERAAYLSGPDNRRTDTGPIAPKGIVLPSRTRDTGVRPTGHLKDDIIYEVHVRGLTQADAAIDDAVRGTYAGAAAKADYLRDLGVTAVEFLPVCQTQNALNDLVDRPGDHNYWGYQTMAFFAPDRRYASDTSPGGPTREWTAMVKAFHDAGLKVFIDVVFNHHEEGGVDPTGQIGTIYSLRGLDNVGYYEVTLAEGRPESYWSSNGVGPNLNATSQIGRDLVIDALTYWTEELGVDGFRFDLGAVLGNKMPDGGYAFDADDPDGVLNRALTLLPERQMGGSPGVDLIAEPYTASGDGWELGGFPRGWAEWNTFFRDTVRRSQNKLGHATLRPAELVRRIAGSDDLFGHNGRRPWASINFVTCHDGFCLNDLHSFADRHNDQPFPYGPSDGGNDAGQEMCWDHGGDASQQLQATRTSLALAMLSIGVPMMTGGSEFHRTQHGNDNPYNLDTKANWLDWTLLDAHADLHAFTRNLLRFRRAHPALRRSDFFTGSPSPGGIVKDVTWLRADGGEMDGAYLDDPDNHFVAWQIDGVPTDDPAARIYIAYNGWIASIDATLPTLPPQYVWRLAIDTSVDASAWQNAHRPSEEPQFDDSHITVDGRAIVALIATARH